MSDITEPIEDYLARAFFNPDNNHQKLLARIEELKAENAALRRTHDLQGHDCGELDEATRRFLRWLDDETPPCTKNYRPAWTAGYLDALRQVREQPLLSYMRPLIEKAHGGYLYTKRLEDVARAGAEVVLNTPRGPLPAISREYLRALEEALGMADPGWRTSPASVYRYRRGVAEMETTVETAVDGEEVTR